MQLGEIPDQENIRDLCDSTTYGRGLGYFRAGRVRSLVYDPHADRYNAVVHGSRNYKVSVLVDEFGGIDADCDCPIFDGDYNICKHVIAVLLLIERYGQIEKRPGGSKSGVNTSIMFPARSAPAPVSSKPAVSESDASLARKVLALFDRPVQEIASQADIKSGTPPINAQVMMEYTCHIASGMRSMIAIELKLGLTRLYVIQKIKDFLEKSEQGTPLKFGKNFVYNSNIHAFSPTDAPIMRLLQEAHNNEQMYREISNHSYYYSYSSRNDRYLHLPPTVWGSVLPHLLSADTKFMLDGVEMGKVAMHEGMPPLHFRMDKGPAADVYRLDMKAVSGIALVPRYGLAFTKAGDLYRMDRAELTRLSELKSTLASAEDGTIIIPPNQLDRYLQLVVPGLKQLGSFTVAASLSDELVNEPLRAKVYLDRKDDLLSAKVSFVYGETEIWPLRSQRNTDSMSGRIVMRDGEHEIDVLNRLCGAGFQQRGDELRMASEEETYQFLFYGLGRLQEIAEVYATSAVDALKSNRGQRPKAIVDIEGGTNWLEVKFELEGVSDKELLLLLRSLTEKRKYHRLSDGSFISLEEEEYEELNRLFEELGIRKSELKGEKIRLPVVRGLSLEEGAYAKGGTVKYGRSLRSLLYNLNNPDNVDAAPPAALASILRDYQKYGFQWMKTLGAYRFGGILADDMGLGKTLQSICYMVSEREGRDFAGAPVLVICPASLVYNWRNELIKFAPQLKAVVAAGSKAERKARLEQAEGADVLITSYPIFRRDVEWYSDKTFHALILDEAQAIKNHATQTAQAIKTISANQRFALTGTPVENRLEELWSIYDAVFPELFAGRTAFAGLTPDQVARKVKPFLLRRLKKDVLKELPDKIETLHTSELLPEQKKLYMAYLLQLKSETAQHLDAEGFQKSRMKILAGLTRLRQLCCHPSLFLENYKGDSGKLEQLLELVDECLDGGKRMLIFSQFTGMLELIRKQLAQRGLKYFYLDGSTKPAERVELCTRFNEGENNLFLISLKAGGTGLNLIGADTVILYDLWWNPAVEQQAADRAHRIGQKHVVQVIKLMTEGTIEEKMHELQQRKKDLIDTVVKPGEELLSALTEADIRELLAL